MPLKKSTKIFWDCWALIEAVLLIASGVMAIFWSDNDLIQALSVIFAASFVIADALSRFAFMLSQYDKEKKDQESVILISGVELTIGIVLIILRETVTEAVVWTLAAVLLSMGGLLLIYSVVLILRKLYAKMWLALVEVVGGAVGVALGILVIFAKIKLGDTFTAIIVGVVLALVGLVVMITAIVDICKDNKAKKAEKQKQENLPQKQGSEAKAKAKKTNNEIIEIDTTKSK